MSLCNVLLSEEQVYHVGENFPPIIFSVALNRFIGMAVHFIRFNSEDNEIETSEGRGGQGCCNISIPARGWEPEEDCWGTLCLFCSRKIFSSWLILSSFIWTNACCLQLVDGWGVWSERTKAWRRNRRKNQELERIGFGSLRGYNRDVDQVCYNSEGVKTDCITFIYWVQRRRGSVPLSISFM